MAAVPGGQLPPPPPGALPEDARTLLRRGRAGAGTILLLAGGDGPTRAGALAALSREAERRGWQVLPASAFASERETPYAALQDLLPRLRPAVPPSRVPAPLATLFAVPTRSSRPSRRSVGEEEAPYGLPPGIRPGEVLFRTEEIRAELEELLLPAEGGPPRLLTVAQGEHLDPASREFLTALATRLDKRPLGIAISLSDDPEVRLAWGRALSGAPAVWARVAGTKAPSGGAEEVRQRARAFQRWPLETLRAAAAAVLAGPDASLSFLPIALERPAGELAEALDTAVKAGALWKEGHRYHPADAASAEALLRDAGPAEVARLHAALAKGLKRVHPVLHGNALFRVADHWAKSGNAMQAVPALLASAGEARRRGAVDAAEAELRRAVLLAQAEASKEARRWEEQVHSALGGVLASAGSIHDAVEEYERAKSLAEERSPNVAAWGPHEERILYLGVAAATGEDLEPRLLDLIAAARKGKQPGLEGNALASLIHFYGTRGSYEDAMQLAPRAVESLREAGDVPGLIRALRMESLANLGRVPPDLEACRVPLRQAVELAKTTHDPAAESYALDNWSLCEWSLGERGEALRREEQALTVARRSGSRFAVVSVLSNLAEFCVEEGTLDRAEEVLREGMQERERLRLDPAHAISTQMKLAEARLRVARGDLASGRALLGDLVGIVDRSRDLELLAQALLHLADVQLQMGDRADARRTVRRLDREGLRRRVPANCRALLERVQAELGPD